MMTILTGLVFMMVGILGLIWLAVTANRQLAVARAKRELLTYMSKNGIKHPALEQKIKNVEYDDILAYHRLDEYKYQILQVERSMKHG